MGKPELEPSKIPVAAEGSRVVDGHHHQEALAQELQGKRRG